MFVQATLNSILLGGIYAMVAVGLSLVFGVMRIFNWANGELLMIATYLTIYLIKATGIHPYLTMFVAAPLMFALGYFMQKGPINYILKRETSREPLSVMIFTAGIAYIIKNLCILLFSTNSKAATTSLTAATWNLHGIVITKSRVFAFIAALIVVGVLEWMLTKTELGLGLRCATQDRESAQLMGMDIQKLYCLALGMGYACLGVAAAVLSPIYAVDPNFGATWSIKCLIIVVLGGKGSIPGALLGGMIVGFAETFGALLGSGIYAQALIFAVFIAVLMFKPNGLLSKDRG